MVEFPLHKWSIAIVASIVSDAPPLSEVPQLELAVCASSKAQEVLILVAENDAFDCPFVASNLESYPV